MLLCSLQNFAHHSRDALHLLLRRQARKAHAASHVNGLSQAPGEDLRQSCCVVYAGTLRRQGCADGVAAVESLERGSQWWPTMDGKLIGKRGQLGLMLILEWENLRLA